MPREGKEGEEEVADEGEEAARAGRLVLDTEMSTPLVARMLMRPGSLEGGDTSVASAAANARRAVGRGLARGRHDGRREEG